MKKTIFIVFIFFLANEISSQVLSIAFCGDLRFQFSAPSNYTLDGTIEIASLPFEGMNKFMSGAYNRLDTIQNGCFIRLFDTGGNGHDMRITYHHVFNNGTVPQPLDIASSHEYADTCNGEWGFNKYKITFKIQPTGETYVFYFNNLDNNYGKDNWAGRNIYANDWTIIYKSNLTSGSRVELRGTAITTGDSLFATISTTDTANGLPTRELKVWELLYNRSQPFSRRFYARTTPFGISPQYIEQGLNRNLILGTTVILDTVYNNLGANDRRGYNTVDTNGGGGTIGGGWITPTPYPYYYSHPPIDEEDFEIGNTYTTPAYFYFDGNDWKYGTKITAESGDTLWLKRRKILWITGIRDRLNSQLFQGDTIHFKSGSTLILEPSAELEADRGGVIIYNTGSNVTWNEHTCSSAGEQSQIVFTGGGTQVVNNGGFIQINDGGKLILGDNTTLSFESDISPLILNPGSQVVLGSNAKIQFKNGAHLRANGCTFTSSGTWQGITLQNSTYDTVRNCTFSNASTYIDMSLNDTTAIYKKTITGNTFNSGGIKIRNGYNLNISGNTFNSLSTGGYLLEITSNINAPSLTRIFNVTNNTFKGGSVQLYLNCYASNVTPFYISGNTFQGLTSGYSVCLIGNKISGDFKNNTFADNHYATGIQLLNSDVNFLNNIIKTTTNNNIYAQVSAYLHLAPIIINVNGDLAWYGGYNTMYLDNSNTQSSDIANVSFEDGCVLYGDKGNNCFNINNITPNHHVWGSQGGPCIEDPYYITKNQWSLSTPKITIACIGGYVTVIYSPALSSCPSINDLNADSYITSDKGDGIIDSIKVTSGGGDASITNPPSAGGKTLFSGVNPDELLYGEIIRDSKTRNYSSAITKSKELIDSYDSSMYFVNTLDQLYMAYQMTDTSVTNTNNHFSELQTYIETKMEQYENNSLFVEKAYSCYLMCLVRKRQYSTAISGYENIMENHPDPVVRLTASWDRAAVVLLMNGQGGSFSSVGIKRLSVRKPNDKRPDKIAKKVFKLSKEIAKENKNTKTERFTKEEKNIISERVVKFNPSTRKEFDEKVSGDIALMLGLGNNNPQNNNSNNIPGRYKLYQNYPNPFNPTTTIKYDIPKDNFVSIKIYDILGREVFNLNEFKTAGSYEVKFDGTNFASGMYFYKIEAGNFTDTKKMVLVK